MASPASSWRKTSSCAATQQLADGGVDFVLNCNVGEDISFDAIRGKHDAVLIATGVYKTRDLDIDSTDAGGVVRAIDYLTASNQDRFRR